VAAVYKGAFAAISGLLGVLRALTRPGQYYGRTLRRLVRRASPLVRALFLAWLTVGAMAATFTLSGLLLSLHALAAGGIGGLLGGLPGIVVEAFKLSIVAPLLFGFVDSAILYLILAAAERSPPSLAGLLLVRMSSILPYTIKALIASWRGGGLREVYAYTLHGGPLGALGLAFTLAGAALTAYGLAKSLDVRPPAAAAAAGTLWAVHLLAGLA